MRAESAEKIKPVAAALRAVGLPEKPKFGHPCNHCGLCCAVQQCPASLEIFGPGHLPCPALVKVDGKALCGVVVKEQQEDPPPVVQKMLGVGVGCSLTDVDTTEEEKEDYDGRQLVYTREHYTPRLKD